MLRRKVFFIVIIMCFMLLGCNKEEQEKDMQYIKKLPVVTVNGIEVPVYKFNSCIPGKDYKPEEGPKGKPCPRVSEEEFMKDKPAQDVGKGLEIKIRSDIPPGGIKEDAPKEEVKRDESVQLLKNGEVVLSPLTSKFTNKKTEKESITTIHVETEAGVYVGVVYRHTPNGSMEYAFKFEVKE
ncbi:hypothetical protein [Bacillus rhizoplanae]|uniref:hypothetical protein n=1 Tax=Bacillus rhizoplanae TaxID=2880966 RepID=UPI003D246B42